MSGKICIKCFLLIYLYVCGIITGEVTEWSKVLAWKVSVPHKGTGGSNPFLSAILGYQTTFHFDRNKLYYNY